MNLLLILPSERLGATSATIKGDRAAYIRQWHSLVPGIEIMAGELGGNRGRAVVRRTDPEIELELDLSLPPLRRSGLVAIAAITRPQTVKKVIALSATLGIDSLHLVNSEKVVKSYLQSKSLMPTNVQAEILKGLEQAGDTIPPQVNIHRSKMSFFELELPSVLARLDQSSYRFVGSLAAGSPIELASFGTRSARSGIFAIGPESGWTQSELDQFERLDFERISLGDRILRVETAFGIFAGILGSLVSKV